MDVWRPGHADRSFDAKFGFRDYRGGGRSSGRETVSRVAGGAIAAALLATSGISVLAYPVEVGGIAAPVLDPENAQNRPFFCPNDETHAAWEERCASARSEGDTVGGIVEIVRITSYNVCYTKLLRVTLAPVNVTVSWTEPTSR